jgi:hypothetical protein
MNISFLQKFLKKRLQHYGPIIFISFLSPFLNNGLITESSNRERKEPDIFDLLKIYFKGAMIMGNLL